MPLGRLVGDVLVTTAFLSYAGPFNQEYRNKMMLTWYKNLDARKVPYTQELDVTTWLVDNATVGGSTFEVYLLLNPIPKSTHTMLIERLQFYTFCHACR